eukprot:4174907-Pyramimonas_sp.AAC.1
MQSGLKSSFNRIGARPGDPGPRQVWTMGLDWPASSPRSPWDGFLRTRRGGPPRGPWGASTTSWTNGLRYGAPSPA